MKPGMPMPRLPEVIGGTGDALERFMGDYLVGMFDHANPLAFGAVPALSVSPVFEWKGFSVSLVQLPAGGVHASTDTADVIEFDVFVEIERSVGEDLFLPTDHVGIQAVRIPAGVPCVRRAGVSGAAWLAFKA
jgi:hypothetical protein